MPGADDFPRIRDIGLTGMLVSFADQLSNSANRAALAFRTVIEAEQWEGVEETTTTLVSVFLRFDPLHLSHGLLKARLTSLLDVRDWYSAPLPRGRSLWHIPTVIGGQYGPQFLEAAHYAGVNAEQARQEIANSRLRVLTIGFAPGQPYMGELPEHWNIPRMTHLNPQVPAGSLVAAIRQLIIFARPAPTGWRHVGQTAFECFRPTSEQPFPLSPGDEITFREITVEELDDIRRTDSSGNGGAIREEAG